MGKVAHFVKHVGEVEARGENDTFRLWESYREQAMLWRVMALAQMLGTFLLVCFCFYLYNTREVTLHVPSEPLPGQYSIHEIPEAVIIEQATELVNLIATYQPYVAEKQFRAALEMLDEPALSIFKEKMLGLELSAIRSTSRTQLFFVDPTKTSIQMTESGIKVSMVGERAKFIAGKQLPAIYTKYTFTFVTRPRNKLNLYGLTATNIEVQDVRAF